MDPIQTTGSDQLKISVAAPPLWTYIAGDSIIGSVDRCSHVAVPDAIMSIALIGRARTFIERDSHNSAKKYHGVWELFEFAPQILYRGPVPKAGSSDTDIITIPFEINIPKTTSLPAHDDHAQAESFLPLHAGYIAQHPLSGSFSSEWPGAKSCIDYHLQAQMKYMHNGSSQIYRATAPIILGHPTVDPSTICFALQRRSISSRVSDHRMLPPSQKENLSLMQKAQKMLSFSKKPGFCFTVDMLMPLHIQLDNPTPFPLILRVVPQDKEPGEVRKDIVQLIKINWMTLSISSQVEIVCKPDGSSSRHKIPKDENVFTQSLGLKQVFSELKEPIVTFFGPRDQHINIGNILQLALRHDGLTSGGKRISQSLSIQPSFVTFNIRLSHSLIWDISLDIAGETKTFSTGAGLTIHNSATRS